MNTLTLVAIRNKRRINLVLLILIIVTLLFPIGIVIADEMGGFGSESLLGRAGVSNSELFIGFNNGGYLDIGTGGVHFDPSTPVGSEINLFPLVFVALGLVLIIKIIRDGLTLIGIITVAALIYIMIALLTGMQDSITHTLFGG